MKASIKSDYACRAVEALALHYPNPQPLCIEEIARRRRIPQNYLVQILLELKRHGLIQSRRGKMGGYVLARAPEQITLGDVLRAVQGEVMDLSSLSKPDCPGEIKAAWRHVKTAAETAANEITFEKICAAADHPSPMYHI
jgi:Rrf2 family transcriptional regulator, cysteine metabolism repressor